MIEVAGLRLQRTRQRAEDASPAVIMLHGFGSSLHTWQPWARALRGTTASSASICPVPGYRSRTPPGDYTDARAMQILAALMDQLGVARASLVGNSIGGRIAWTFGIFCRARGRLRLVSPDGFESPGIVYGEKPDVPAMVKLMRYVLPKALLRTNLEAAYGNPAALTDETVNRYYDLMLAPGVRDAMIARMEQSVRVDPEPRLRRIQSPVLLVWGKKDAMIPFANAADYAKVLPESTLTALPELGHVPQEEAPADSWARSKPSSIANDGAVRTLGRVSSPSDRRCRGSPAWKPCRRRRSTLAR